ncbi:MAG: DUF4386 domain-containing protein [Ignavibacteriales bacterium]|nr:DUF4386 domain-containing protein [Ignavibacteriales bacterium]MCB9220010.1 DUF4386 domain-containing protein [Ignavibacteriales bacterium]
MEVQDSNIIQKYNIQNAVIVSGVSILIMTFAAIIATQITIGSLFVETDAIITAQNIKSNLTLFRAGTIAWIIILICDVFASWGLYNLLKPVDKSLALLMSWLRLIYSAILGAAIINLIKVIVLINSNLHINTLGIENFTTEVYFNMGVFYETWSYGLILFSLHILILGYLSYKSRYIPKYFSVLLMLAFVGYFITNVSNLMFTDYKEYKTIIEMIFIIPMLSEVAFAIWLLISRAKLNVLSLTKSE